MKEERTMTNNERTMTLKLKRIEVIDILMALTYTEEESEAEKWGKLHDKIMKMLDDFDLKNDIGVFHQ